MKTSITKSIWQELQTADKPVVKVLHKTDKTKIVGVGLKKGVMLAEHLTKVPTKMIVIEGQIQYSQKGEETILSKLDEWDIPVEVLHEVLGLENSLFVLMMELG
ncbi:hypothetical protein N6H18_14885 [Reichenbachiella agarivorans]|uniref:Uncharacterized protein n=1 Tax=Reichenbachiella agarivorans TaxID=2979464 RepID=A0ABY6CMC9_9BACT|nr:hypothetical protein [Reichenbachiella agarivorans]UXP31632.1 hypothetical protein N6H18_14885 [Reichenbachiella agarivorans]